MSRKQTIAVLYFFGIILARMLGDCIGAAMHRRLTTQELMHGASVLHRSELGRTIHEALVNTCMWARRLGFALGSSRVFPPFG